MNSHALNGFWFIIQKEQPFVVGLLFYLLSVVSRFLVIIGSLSGHFGFDLGQNIRSVYARKRHHSPHETVVFGDFASFVKPPTRFFEPRYLHHRFRLQEWLWSAILGAFSLA